MRVKGEERQSRVVGELPCSPVANTHPPLPKQGFPGGSGGKASVCNVGDPGSIPGLGTSPGEGNGSPFYYSCLENLMGGGAW